VTRAIQTIGKEAAIHLAESGWWKTKTDREIAEFQMLTMELCLPFERFHEAVEKTLGRPVYTHEFSSLGFDGLLAELFDAAPPRTFGDILDLIPAEKRILVLRPKGKEMP
jgi:hypothetical protein